MCARQVRFTTIEIIEFPIILGDNPAVSSGPPLTIDWEPQQRTQFDLNVFEEYRPKRRHRKDLPIDPVIREEVLVASGIGLDQILFWQDLSAKNDIKKPKKQSLLSKSLKKARKISDLGSRERRSVHMLQKMNQSLFSIVGSGGMGEQKHSIRV